LNTPRKESIFDRSGLAALSDLQCSEQQEIFLQLEREQDVFLERQSEFLSDNYRWPRAPLHTWSRVWEYPYVYYHLRKQVETLGPERDYSVVDLGSAVTFFPFSIAKLGYRVHCLDVDVACELNIKRAANAVPHPLGKVDFKLILDGRMPLKDGEVDTVYCISVLEHIPNFEDTIQEVVRVLKTKGRLILTIDMDLGGSMEMGVGRYYKLRSCLAEHFDLKEPEITVHPLDVLQPRNGPFPDMTYSIWQSRMFYFRQRIKQLMGKKALHDLPNLAVWGAVMTKRAK